MLKNKLAILLITILFFTGAAQADFDSGIDGADFTGEAFFEPFGNQDSQIVGPSEDNVVGGQSAVAMKKPKGNKTVPPIKQLRIKIMNAMIRRSNNSNELAPTGAKPYEGETDFSEYSSQEVTENFDDIDSVETETETVEKVSSKGKSKSLSKKKSKSENKNSAEDIILDCEKVDYDTENYLIFARGNVAVEFVKQGTTVKADLITFDRANNTIKAEGNVHIYKGDKVIDGDYIFVDLNEENALIENPYTQTATIEMRAKKGYVYGDKITQEHGLLSIDQSYPLEFRSRRNGPRVDEMLRPKKVETPEDIEKNIFRMEAREIKVTQKGDLETIAIKKGKISKGQKTIFKVPAVKIYTNKNHDYFETNMWEIGSYRGLGFYTGPGWVFELPKGSVFKAMPIFNYKSGAGFGALGRFSSGTNTTVAAYGSAEDKVIVYGRQELDDKLFMQYGMNAYMDEWFLGRRRPKYGVSLIYMDKYSSQDFLLKNKTSMFSHRIEAGYFQDLDFDQKFEKIDGGRNIGTTRFRYMAMANQELWSKQDRENLKLIRILLNAQLSAALYGTGDTQLIGRAGPIVRMQYKRWMQDIGYHFSVYDDNSPMPLFDAYRFGGQALSLRESLRLCKWLTVTWYGVFNTTNDSSTHRSIQGNSFYLSIGPDEFRFNIGYDFMRDTFRCLFEVLMDAKGTRVKYDKLEITQQKKPKKEEKLVVERKVNPNAAPVAPPVLNKAIVEDVKVMEEVL